MNKGAHTWKFVRIHGNGSGGTCRGQGGVSVWAEGESPQSGATWLTTTTEEDVVVPRVNGDHLFFKQETASMVTQWPNAHYIMMELGQYVSRDVGEVGQKEVARSCRCKRWSAGGAGEDLGCVGVDAVTRSLWC